jgi:hypothetical protein
MLRHGHPTLPDQHEGPGKVEVVRDPKTGQLLNLRVTRGTCSVCGHVFAPTRNKQGSWYNDPT